MKSLLLVLALSLSLGSPCWAQDANPDSGGAGTPELLNSGFAVANQPWSPQVQDQLPHGGNCHAFFTSPDDASNAGTLHGTITKSGQKFYIITTPGTFTFPTSGATVTVYFNLECGKDFTHIYTFTFAVQ